MRTKIEVWLEPFEVPDCVKIDMGCVDMGPDTRYHPLSALSSEDLDKLCRDFRTEVFRKAGKSEPAQIVPYCPKCDR